MEQELIDTAKKYLASGDDPTSESLLDQLLELAKEIQPITRAGKAIVAWVKAEEATDFSMSAGTEFEAMEKILKGQ